MKPNWLDAAPPPRIYPRSSNDDALKWPSNPDRIVYYEVPASLITQPDAAAKYGVNYGTLNVALFRGKIPRAGRLCGGSQLRCQRLIIEDALVSCIQSSLAKAGDVGEYLVGGLGPDKRLGSFVGDVQVVVDGCF